VDDIRTWHEDPSIHFIGGSLLKPTTVTDVAVDGVGAVGVLPAAAREDHQHGLTSFLADTETTLTVYQNSVSQAAVMTWNYIKHGFIGDLFVLVARGTWTGTAAGASYGAVKITSSIDYPTTDLSGLSLVETLFQQIGGVFDFVYADVDAGNPDELLFIRDAATTFYTGFPASDTFDNGDQFRLRLMYYCTDRGGW